MDILKKLTTFLPIKIPVLLLIFAIYIVGIENATANDKKAEVGCSVYDFFGDAMLQFSGIKNNEERNFFMENFSSGQEGVISVEVFIEGNDKYWEASFPFHYTVKKERIEPTEISLSINMYAISSLDDYKSSFGAFPEVKCYLADQ